MSSLQYYQRNHLDLSFHATPENVLVNGREWLGVKKSGSNKDKQKISYESERYATGNKIVVEHVSGV